MPALFPPVFIFPHRPTRRDEKDAQVRPSSDSGGSRTSSCSVRAPLAPRLPDFRVYVTMMLQCGRFVLALFTPQNFPPYSKCLKACEPDIYINQNQSSFSILVVFFRPRAVPLYKGPAFIQGVLFHLVRELEVSPHTKPNVLRRRVPRLRRPDAHRPAPRA